MGMIVPDFWAEGQAQARHNGRAVTVRRFGWSNTNGQEAQNMANARAQEALARILAGEPLRKRERKVPYNGGDGLPIREEVVARHGEEVITRNNYGALCLNTPRVLFADVNAYDEPQPSWWGRYALLLVGCVLLAGVSWRVLAPAAGTMQGANKLGYALGLGVLLGAMLIGLTSRMRRAAWQRHNARDGGPKGRARQRVAAFAAAHPDWGLRLYETPAGLRLLATHQCLIHWSQRLQNFLPQWGWTRFTPICAAISAAFGRGSAPNPGAFRWELASSPGLLLGQPRLNASKSAWLGCISMTSKHGLLLLAASIRRWAMLWWTQPSRPWCSCMTIPARLCTTIGLWPEGMGKGVLC